LSGTGGQKKTESGSFDTLVLPLGLRKNRGGRPADCRTVRTGEGRILPRRYRSIKKNLKKKAQNRLNGGKTPIEEKTKVVCEARQSR